MAVLTETHNTRPTLRSSALWISTTALFLAMNIGMSSFGVPVPGGHLYLNDIVSGNICRKTYHSNRR